MNHSPPVTSGYNTADVVNIRAFLQQAVDHYPRLVAFSFTLKLPHREALNEYQSLILRFHTDVWQRTGEYSRERQQARHHSPPTLLRWMWESASAPECNMLLMMNLDTLGTIRNRQLTENAQREMIGIIREAWLTVTGAEHNSVANIMSVIINRSDSETFTTPFHQLKARVRAMASPVMTARTAVTA